MIRRKHHLRFSDMMAAAVFMQHRWVTVQDLAEYLRVSKCSAQKMLDDMRNSMLSIERRCDPTHLQRSYYRLVEHPFK